MSEAVITVKIEDLSRGGAGVAKLDTPEGKQVVFVPYTLPGDLVQVTIVEQAKRFSNAELVRILEPSPDRVPAPCPVFGKCGGCTWQHIPYAMQWKTKVEGVRHALQRTERPWSGPFDEFPAAQPWNYRNRIQLRGRAQVGAEPELGFFARGSKKLIPVERCDIARKEINQALTKIRKEAGSFGPEFKVEVEVLTNGEIRHAWNANHGAMGFRQVNDDQNLKLQNYISRHLSDGAHVYDLFGGNGNLSLGLVNRVKTVDCVDVGSPTENGPAKPANFRFFKTDAVKWIDRQAQSKKHGTYAQSGPFEAILDPPREGLGKGFDQVADAFETLGVKKIVAVGCDPDAWARDVSRFQKRGYEMIASAVFDLFPQTPHVEAVGVLVFRDSFKAR